MIKKLLLLTLLVVSANAQELEKTILEIMETNPIIQERLKHYNVTKQEIKSAQAAYYPVIDLTLGAGVENKSDLAISPTNDETLDTYQGTLTYTHNIFKGFETNHQVDKQKHRSVSAAYSYIETVNDTTLELIDTYLQVMKNHDLLKTAQENVDINHEIFVKVKKLYESGLTTLSEVNKIESSLSLAKSNLVIQENTLLDVTYNLHGVLGRYLDYEKMVKPTFSTKLPKTLKEATQFAIQNNPSILVSNYNIKLAQATKREKESSFYPHLDLEISQSYNKNTNVIESEDNRFKAMAYLKYNIFNGFKDSADLQNSISKIHQEVETKNQLRRKVIEGLNLSWASKTKLEVQLQHLKDYKKFSLKTLTLYAKEYDLGRRSLLDLLSAQNDFIGSKSQIITAEYNILFAKYRILDAMGNLLPSILGDKDISYQKVDLVSNTLSTEDSLPIHLDKDQDLITDDKDICNNSLISSNQKDIYGCETNNSNIISIDRYSGFLFGNDNNQIDEITHSAITKLIKELQEHKNHRLKISLLSNTFNENYSQKELDKLSMQRGKKVKELFIQAGFKEKDISIISNGDSAPIYLDNEAKNNRVDIVVEKIKKL